MEFSIGEVTTEMRNGYKPSLPARGRRGLKEFLDTRLVILKFNNQV